MEKALEQRVDTLDEHEFPPRLDLFKAVAAQLVKRHEEEEDDPLLAELGPTWLRGYLNRHPTYSTKFFVTLDCQQALASNPTLIKDYFQKLSKVLKKFFCFVLNQLFDIPLHAAQRAMAVAHAAASRKQETTAFSPRYTHFLPPDQLAQS